MVHYNTTRSATRQASKEKALSRDTHLIALAALVFETLAVAPDAVFDMDDPLLVVAETRSLYTPHLS
jgi:hypothetical protein